MRCCLLSLPWLQVALLEGMESLNQAKVGSALQVFYNLEELPQVSAAGQEQGQLAVVLSCDACVHCMAFQWLA